jgi:hypothetical protein
MRRAPRPGWVRADQLASTEAAAEIVRLRQLNDQLAQELSKVSVARPTGSEGLAQDDDQVELAFAVTLTDRSAGYPYQHQRVTTTELFSWRELLVACGPYLLSESKLSNIKSALNRILKDKVYPDISAAHPDLDFGAATVHESSLQLVIVQFTTLGYLQISTSRDEGGKELRTAVLTPLGRSELMAASAVRRGVTATAKAEGLSAIE